MSNKTATFPSLYYLFIYLCFDKLHLRRRAKNYSLGEEKKEKRKS
jgi:hypothetical protein